MTKPKTPKAKAELLDPRQALFIELYATPGETFGNAYQSAVKAGYSEEYSKNLKTRQQWVSENVKEVTKDELVKKAKKVLHRSLDSQDERLAQDTAKFVAKTDIEFSEKQEHSITFPQPLLGGESKDA